MIVKKRTSFVHLREPADEFYKEKDKKCNFVHLRQYADLDEDGGRGGAGVPSVGRLQLQHTWGNPSTGDHLGIFEYMWLKLTYDILQVQQLLGPSSLSRDLDFPREQEVTVIRILEFFKGFFPFLPPREGIKKVWEGFKAFPIKGGGLFSPKNTD